MSATNERKIDMIVGGRNVVELGINTFAEVAVALRTSSEGVGLEQIAKQVGTNPQVVEAVQRRLALQAIAKKQLWLSQTGLVD